MLRIVVRRLLQLIRIRFGLSILMFAWARSLPGDPSDALLAGAQPSGDPVVTKEAVTEVRRLYGLDRPVHEQYLTWLGSVARLTSDSPSPPARTSATTCAVGFRPPSS